MASKVQQFDSRSWKQFVALFLTVIEITAPVFLLALVGFVWVKLGFEYRLEFVTRFAMTLSVPALIFVSLIQTDIDPVALSTVSLAALSCYIVLTVIMFGFCKALNLNIRTYLAPLIVGNTGNMGLPLALFAFGEIGLAYAIVVFAVMAIYSFTFGIWVVSGGGSITKVFREPLVLATLLGAIFLWNGWTTPTFLTNTLDLLGQIAIPMMLITLGVAVARIPWKGVSKAFWISLVRSGLCIAVATAIGLYFELNTIALGVLIVQISTPVAVTSYLIAEKYKADGESVAGLVVVSTILSMITIPLTLAFVI